MKLLLPLIYFWLLVTHAAFAGWMAEISNDNFPRGERFPIEKAPTRCPPTHPPLEAIRCGLPVQLIFDGVPVSAVIFDRKEHQQIFIWFGSSDYEIEPIDQNQTYHLNVIEYPWPEEAEEVSAKIKIWYE